jgi:autotransporter-associated beta strand protein
VIGGAGGLTKDYQNDVVISGSSPNTYGGTTTVKSGILLLAKTAGVNAVPGNVVVGDGVVDATFHHGDILRLGASNQIPDSAIVTVNAGGASGSSGKWELNGFNETLGGISSTANLAVIQVREAGAAGVNSTLTVNNPASSAFGGIIRDGGSAGSILSLVKTGTGTLTLNGNQSNSFSGGLTVNAGQVDLAKTSGSQAVASNLVIGDGTGTDVVRWVNSNQVSDGSLITFNAGGQAQLNGQSDIVGALQSTGGAGLVDNAVGTAMTLTIGGGNTSGSFSGLISNSGGGALNLAKTGTGAQTLTSAHTYTGKTTVSGGTLQITTGNESSLGAPAAAADALLLNGGTLQVSTANLTINDAGRQVTAGINGGTFNVDLGRVLTVANQINAGGTSITKSGSGTLNLTGNTLASTLNLSSGLTDISGGYLRADTMNLSGGTFNWGTGRISHLTKVSQTGVTNFSQAGYQEIRLGTTLTVNGNLTSTSGSLLELHGSPTIYINNGNRFNNLQVNGNLDLNLGGDILEVEINPYFLRPFSPSLGPAVNEYGSLPLVVASGQIFGTFDTFGAVQNDGLGFTQFTGAFTSASALPVNTWYVQYTSNTLFFHYRVAGYVPEPGTFSLMAAGVVSLRYLRRRKSGYLLSSDGDTPARRSRRRKNSNRPDVDRPLHVLRPPESSERF